MKKNIIFLLLVCLSFTFFHLNTLEAGTPPRCSVTISIVGIDSCTFNVNKGAVKIGDKTILDKIQGLDIPSGMVIDDSLDCSECKFDASGCIDSASRIVAILITKEEYQTKKDSELWSRLSPRVDERVKELSKDPNETIGWNIWQRIALYSALFLSIASILLTLFYNKKRKASLRNDVVDIVRDSDRLKEWRDEIKVAEKTPTIVNTSNDDIRNLQKRVTELEAALRLSQAAGQTMGSSSSTTSSPQKGGSPSPKMLYADSIIEGKFTRVKESPGEDSIFELKLKGDSHANVTIYKPAHKKVLANPSYLEGCEKQLLGNASVSIEREGEAQKNDNGKWVVTTPLKVKVS